VQLDFVCFNSDHQEFFDLRRFNFGPRNVNGRSCPTLTSYLLILFVRVQTEQKRRASRLLQLDRLICQTSQINMRGEDLT
jgi:hypothetical protein